MVDSQAQSLFLQSNKGRWALVTTRNFPLGPPSASVQSSTAKGHDAICYGSRERLVGGDSVCSLPHIPMWVALWRSGTLRSGALRGMAAATFPFSTCRKADGLTVMLHSWALRSKSLHASSHNMSDQSTWTTVTTPKCFSKSATIYSSRLKVCK